MWPNPAVKADDDVEYHLEVTVADCPPKQPQRDFLRYCQLEVIGLDLLPFVVGFAKRSQC